MHVFLKFLCWISDFTHLIQCLLSFCFSGLLWQHSADHGTVLSTRTGCDRLHRIRNEQTPAVLQPLTEKGKTRALLISYLVDIVRFWLRTTNRWFFDFAVMHECEVGTKLQNHCCFATWQFHLWSQSRSVNSSVFSTPLFPNPSLKLLGILSLNRSPWIWGWRGQQKKIICTAL